MNGARQRSRRQMGEARIGLAPLLAELEALRMSPAELSSGVHTIHIGCRIQKAKNEGACHWPSLPLRENCVWSFTVGIGGDAPTSFDALIARRELLGIDSAHIMFAANSSSLCAT